MNTWIVLPMKSLARAKSRLDGVLDGEQRQHFARGLFEHVLARSQESVDQLGLAGILVLTNGDEIARASLDAGVAILRDDQELAGQADQAGHLGRVVDAGLAHVARRGGDRALVLMADLPHLTNADISTMLERARNHPMVVAPDGQERGTNALALSPPERIRTCFGHPDSLPRHLDAARSARISVSIYRSPSTALDIDRPFDYSGNE